VARNTCSPSPRSQPFSNSRSSRTESDKSRALIVDTTTAASRRSRISPSRTARLVLSDAPTAQRLAGVAPGVTPEMAARSPDQRVKDLMVMAAKCAVERPFRDTIGFRPTLGAAAAHHPTDDLRALAASILDGLCSRADAVIGINPRDDSPSARRAARHARRGARQARHPDQTACWRTSPPRSSSSAKARRSIWCFPVDRGHASRQKSSAMDLALLSDARAAACRFTRHRSATT